MGWGGGSASLPTSVGVGHARRSPCRRLRHCRPPTAISPSSCRRRCIAGLDRHAFRRANIHRRCTRWNLLLLHLRERTPHCVEARFPGIHRHCLGLGLLLVPQPLHPLRALREQELEEAAATGEHASEDLRRATAGLRRCGNTHRSVAREAQAVVHLPTTIERLSLQRVDPLDRLRGFAVGKPPPPGEPQSPGAQGVVKS
jgi:hypothetical protein